MKRFNSSRNFAALVLVFTMLTMPLAAIAQTQVKAPRNKYKVQDDVKAGREYSAQVEKEFPILRDAESTAYLEGVGRRLVNAIPPEFQQPAFQYSFKIVNARDINAFALPGGPMYVNRGMIEAAKNEGEMAGVMAHEISHVALRHATAQATQQSNPINQILGIGAILGGAILGGQAGAQIGQTIYASLLVLPYSREYETQADTLGAQIMARAGYDPRDLANMFKTIEKESGGSGPEWLSTHPSPENRYENINRESGLLRVSPNPIKITRGFERTQSKLRALPRAKTMQEIDAENKRNGGGNQNGGQNPTSSGKYETRVEYPSARTRAYSNGDLLQMSVPDNWQDFPSQSEIWFAPQGAYGDQGITRGALVGLYKPQNKNLADATDEYVGGILKENGYLRQNSGYTRTTLSGRTAYAAALSGRSPVTNRTELATVYTTMLRDGQLFYIVTVVPQDEATAYNSAFRNLLRSVRLTD
ncbi:MAG: M48 family metalloprotease [Acidobacteria bacterium]|nr:M48 family metalloprotease [Acidobacteriota bacterium]